MTLVDVPASSCLSGWHAYNEPSCKLESVCDSPGYGYAYFFNYSERMPSTFKWRSSGYACACSSGGVPLSVKALGLSRVHCRDLPSAARHLPLQHCECPRKQVMGIFVFGALRQVLKRPWPRMQDGPMLHCVGGDNVHPWTLPMPQTMVIHTDLTNTM